MSGDRKALLARVITALATSNIPPSFQDHVINNLGSVPDAQLDQIGQVLQTLIDSVQQYHCAAATVEQVLADIEAHLHSKLQAEASRMVQELDRELGRTSGHSTR